VQQHAIDHRTTIQCTYLIAFASSAAPIQYIAFSQSHSVVMGKVMMYEGHVIGVVENALTETTLSKQPSRLRARWWGRGVLELRGL